jgi:hypothetical protein
MIAIARGSITEPDRLGPFIDDDMRAVEQLKADGVMREPYGRAAGRWSCHLPRRRELGRHEGAY